MLLPFSFEIEIEDDKGILRRFRASTFQIESNVHPNITTIPLQLDEGWNYVALDLSTLCSRAYGTNYTCTNRIQVHSNTRIRRIYFSDKHEVENLPKEMKL